jgi:hypothetical protein
MRAAGREEDDLPWQQLRVPEQQRRDDAHVPWMIAGDRRDRGALGVVGAVVIDLAVAGLRHVAGKGASLIGGPAEDAGEDGRAHVALGVCPIPVEERGRQRFQLGDGQLAQELRRVRRVPHARQHLERGKGVEELGLGPVIDVVAALVAGPEAALVLLPVSGLRLDARRVHLDRQRLARGEHLEQEREPSAEALRAVRAQLARRVRRDDGVQGGPPAVSLQARWRRGVRAHPQLGLRAGRRDWPALELRDRLPRSPRVRLHYWLEMVH